MYYFLIQPNNDLLLFNVTNHHKKLTMCPSNFLINPSFKRIK